MSSQINKIQFDCCSTEITNRSENVIDHDMSVLEATMTEMSDFFWKKAERSQCVLVSL